MCGKINDLGDFWQDKINRDRRHRGLSEVPLSGEVNKNVIDPDLVNKISSLNGYLKIWLNDGKKPHELFDLIAEVEEWVAENSC